VEIDFALWRLARNTGVLEIVRQYACDIMRDIEQGVEGRRHACQASHVEALRLSCPAEVVEPSQEITGQGLIAGMTILRPCRLEA
jgi:hypothetical protein